MKDFLLQILAIAYGGAGVVGAVGYWATIKDLYYYKKISANIITYFLWTFTSGVTLLYSVFVLPSFLFVFVSFINFFACTVILFLTLNLLRKSRCICKLKMVK